MADRFTRRLWLVTAAVLVLIAAWTAAPLIRAELGARLSEPRLVAPRGELAATETTTIELFEAARASVVSISTAERVIDPWSRNAYDVPRGTGTGFVWDEQGHVVTNHHVIEGASGAVVRLADGRSFRARLVGTDPRHDLAVLRIGRGRSSLPAPLPVGESENLRVGQSVFAIGNPFGLDWTLTTGIVSALDRELPREGRDPIRGLIQTDAAINPGNSGGPLIDSAGRVVGVNTAIYSPSGSSAGIGFAVPIDTVNRVVPQLISQGHYAAPSLGVTTDARADALWQRSGGSGVMVLDVEPGSAADRAGLRPARLADSGRLVPGDILVGLDGTEIASGADLRAALDAHRAGQEVTLTIERDGERRQMTVELDPGE